MKNLFMERLWISEFWAETITFLNCIFHGFFEVLWYVILRYGILVSSHGASLATISD